MGLSVFSRLLEEFSHELRRTPPEATKQFDSEKHCCVPSVREASKPAEQIMATHPVISTEGRHITAHKLDVFSWACGPPIEMKMECSCGCTLMKRGRRRSVYTLDEVRPFLSLIGNARFEPICVAPLLRVVGGW